MGPAIASCERRLWKWLWSKRLSAPFSLRKPLKFGLFKPIFGGGGGIRTCDQGLMSSWLFGSPLVTADRCRPVFGGNKPKAEVSGCRRPGAVCREQSEMDVE